VLQKKGQKGKVNSLRASVRKNLHDVLAIFSSRICGIPLMHVIGDSHALAFQKENFFIVHHVGPATAYNLSSKNSKTKSNEKLLHIVSSINKKKDIAVLVFGEIDSRIHIYYQYMKRNKFESIPQLVDQTVTKYGQTLKLLEDMGLFFIVYGIPPASREENIHKYPFYSDKETRILISKEMNNRLKSLCLQNGYPYVDLQSKFADASGFISEEFAADKVHLNQKAAVLVAKELKFKSKLVKQKKGVSKESKIGNSALLTSFHLSVFGAI
jgi:hypothetical protein